MTSLDKDRRRNKFAAFSIDDSYAEIPDPALSTIDQWVEQEDARESIARFCLFWITAISSILSKYKLSQSKNAPLSVQSDPLSPESIIEEHTVDTDIAAVAENDEAKLNKTVTLNLRI